MRNWMFCLVVLGFSLGAGPAFGGPAHGKGHCGHQGNGTGHGHHDDECDPTPTATSTPTATPAPSATPAPTPAPTATLTPTSTPTPTPVPAFPSPVWKDANGLVVPGIRVLSAVNAVALLALSYQDERGFVWSVDPWTLAVKPINLGHSPTIHRFYPTANCTGPYYFNAEARIYPRIVFRVDGDPTYRTFADIAAPASLALLSYDGGVGMGCVTGYSNTLNVVPGAETAPFPPITVPTLPYTGPLHPE